MAGIPFAREKVTIGKTSSSNRDIVLTRRTIAILEDAGREAGKNLVGGVVKGSFHVADGDDPSKGTHDGSGAFDLSPDLAIPAVELALRKRGVAAWIREPIPNLWGLHLHGVDAFDPDLADGAKRQVTQYNEGTNGLKDHGPDTNRPHPKLVRFPDPEDDMQLTDKVRLKKWQQQFFGGQGGPVKEISVGSLLADAAAQARRNRRHLEALGESVRELASLIAEPLSEADRKKLAAAIAAKVVQLRSELSTDDDDADDDAPEPVTG